MNKLSNKEKNQVLEQAWIDYNPEIVKINEDKIKELVFEQDNSVLSQDENEVLKGKTPKEIVKYLLSLNSINYQFWDVVDGKFIRYQNNGIVGALAMSEGFNKFFNILESNNFNLGLINIETMKYCFGDIPEIEERINIFHEVFNPILFEKALEIIEIDINKGFLDVTTAYNLSKVLPISFDDPYLKKIQLTLFEISEALNQKGYSIISNLTVAADYQIPRVLENRKVLAYNDELSQKINNQEIIEAESKEEKALRAATIIACNEIAEYHKVSIPSLDRMLWLARNESKKPFHLTKTPRY